MGKLSALAGGLMNDKNAPEVKVFSHPKILPVFKINEFRTVVFSWSCSPTFGIAVALQRIELGLFSDVGHAKRS